LTVVILEHIWRVLLLLPKSLNHLLFSLTVEGILQVGVILYHIHH
jgi:hypothetical protein